MARKVKVVPNPGGYRAVMNGDACMGVLQQYADGIRDAADAMGHGRYVCDVRPGVNRAHGRVRTDDVVARVDNARNNTLLKAMGRCRR